MQKVLDKYCEPFIFLLLLLQLVRFILVMKFSVFILPAAFSPDAALRESLPREVIDANNLITKNSLTEFSLSPAFERGALLVAERMVEFNYPVRFKGNSLIVVAKSGEKGFNKCRLIEAGSYTAIYDCANRRH